MNYSVQDAKRGKMNESISNRAGTGTNSLQTAPKQASLGIKESMDSGNPVKVVDGSQTSGAKNSKEPIVKDLK